MDSLALATNTTFSDAIVELGPKWLLNKMQCTTAHGPLAGCGLRVLRMPGFSPCLMSAQLAASDNTDDKPCSEPLTTSARLLAHYLPRYPIRRPPGNVMHGRVVDRLTFPHWAGREIGVIGARGPDLTCIVQVGTAARASEQNCLHRPCGHCHPMTSPSWPA